MTERPSKKGAIAKQLEFDGLSVISKISATRIIAQENRGEFIKEGFSIDFRITHVISYPTV